MIGELYFGAFHSERVEDNIARVDDLVRWYRILVPDEMTAKTYGAIRQQLLIAGAAIPENDLWIAATVKQYNLGLISRDRHFESVPSLSVISW